MPTRTLTKRGLAAPQAVLASAEHRAPAAGAALCAPLVRLAPAGIVSGNVAEFGVAANGVSIVAPDPARPRPSLPSRSGRRTSNHTATVDDTTRAWFPANKMELI